MRHKIAHIPFLVLILSGWIVQWKSTMSKDLYTCTLFTPLSNITFQWIHNSIQSADTSLPATGNIKSSMLMSVNKQVSTNVWNYMYMYFQLSWINYILNNILHTKWKLVHSAQSHSMQIDWCKKSFKLAYPYQVRCFVKISTMFIDMKGYSCWSIKQISGQWFLIEITHSTVFSYPKQNKQITTWNLARHTDWIYQFIY